MAQYIGRSYTHTIEVTRAQLLALRASSSLEDVHYTITDHSQGRLGAVKVTLYSDGKNIGQTAEVLTSFDTESWSGVYDIDRALVVELRDNRDNFCSGTGTEVSNFDWGNTRYDRVRVINHTLTTTDNQNTLTVSRCRFEGGISNFTGAIGTISQSVFELDNTNITNTNVTISRSTINSRVTATAPITIINSKIAGRISQNTGAGLLTLSALFQNDGSITHSSTGTLSITSETHSQHTLQDTGSGNKQLLNGSRGQGTTTFSNNCDGFYQVGVEINSNGRLTVNNSLNTRDFYACITGIGTMNFANNSSTTATKQTYALKVDNNGTVNINNCTGGWTLYYDSVDGIATVNVVSTPTTVYTYANRHEGSSSVTHTSGNKWRLTTTAGYILNTNTQAVNYYYGEGGFSRNLTNANNNRAERITLAPI